jgi:hypothetical protein
LPTQGVTSCGVTSMHHIGEHYLSFIAPTGSCVRPNPSQRLQLSTYALGLCRLSPVPAGRWPFPALAPRYFPRMPGPIPRWSLWCSRPFLPRGLRPSPRRERLGTTHLSEQRLPFGGFFEAAVIPLCSGLRVCSPPWSLPPIRLYVRMAAVAFTSEHPTDRYLPVPRIC